MLLSHNSSLECLRTIPPQVEILRRTTMPLSLDDVVPTRNELLHLAPEEFGIAQIPLHCLFSADARRSEASRIQTHTSCLDALPAGAACELAVGRYVCGPEMTFIQMASVSSLVGAVVLGHELCGRYSHFGRFISGFYERPPLTSVEQIRHVIDALSGMGIRSGVEHAREALRWVRDGSASPMETVVSCMLHLPCRMGGFGLVAPQLNYEQQLDDAARTIAGKDYCAVDTAYVYKIDGVDHKEGLEYDGKDYHRDADADRTRREALAHMGWTIYVVVVDDMTSYLRIKDKVALLDKVPRQRGSEIVNERLGRDLLKRLLRATRFGVGLDAVLFGVKVPRGMVKVHI